LFLMILQMILIFFWDMWAYHSWSCSSINIMPTCYIVTIGFGENKLKVFDHPD
jgi:hypothetical protein